MVRFNSRGKEKHGLIPLKKIISKACSFPLGRSLYSNWSLAFLARLTESNYREAWPLRGVEGGVRDEGRGGGGQLDLVTALLGLPLPLPLLLLLLAIIFSTCESGHPRDASRASRPCLRHCAREVKKQIARDQGEPITRLAAKWTLIEQRKHKCIYLFKLNTSSEFVISIYSYLSYPKLDID